MDILKTISSQWRSSPWRSSVKNSVLKNSANFTGKHLCWTFLLIKLQVLWPATSLLQQICFPVNFTTFFRTSILKNICERLLLPIFPFYYTRKYQKIKGTIMFSGKMKRHTYTNWDFSINSRCNMKVTIWYTF